MSEALIACERTHTLADDGKAPVLVRWEVPQPDDRCWRCTYSISSDGKELSRRSIFGVDGVQALQLAMSAAATDLLMFDPPVYFHEPDDDLGLPVLDVVRDLAAAREARRRGSSGQT